MNNQENLRPIVPKETRLQIKKFGDELAIRTTSQLSENNYYRIAFCQWFFSLDDNEYNEKKRWYLRAQDNTLYTGILMDRAVKEVLTGKISSYLNNWEKHVRRINVPVYINNRIVYKDWDKEFETEVLNPIEDPFKSVPAAGFDLEHLKYLADEMAIIKKDIEEFRSKRVWNQIFFYNNKFFLCFPYSANMVVNVKSSFTSYKWRSEEKWWEIDSSEKKAIRDFALMHKFSFHKNATEFLFGNAEKINASQMVVSDFKVNGFKIEPYPYQNAGIQFGNKAKKILIADEMGLGKSIQSIGIVMSHLSFPCLVVAPKSLLYNWENEWKKFTSHKPYVFYNSKYPLDTVLSIANVVIINYEGVKKLLPFKDRFKSIIVDESHNVKNDKTKRFTEVLEMATGKDVRCLLTGTPIMNAPAELIPQLKILDMLKDINTEKKFRDRYCGKHGGDNLDELNIKLRSSVMIRREKKDVLTDLPDLVRNYVKVDITTREEYNRAENDFVNYLKEVKEMSDRKIKAAMNAEILVKMGILKQISARGKIEAILEYCKSAFDENQKIILFGYHREVLHEYTKRLNSNLLITGATKIEDRQKYVDMFQNDPKQMSICLSIRAASVGLTLTASSNEVFAEFDWTSAMHDQAEARAHRIGQKNSVSANYFVGIDTIDSDIVELINFKRNMINEMTGTKHNVSENSTIIKDLLKKRYNFEPEGEIQA